MTDNERDTLNRLGDQLRPPDDSFDRLLTRRDRQRRNRRVTAAAVALSLTAAGLFGAYQIGRRTSTTPGGGSAALPNVARVECGPAGAVVVTPEARPQRDGIHLDITNTGTKALMFHVVIPDFGGFVERAEPGANTFTVSDLRPDAYEVRCFAEDELNPQNEPAAALQITDQDGVWKDLTVACPAGLREESAFFDAAPGLRGEDGTAEEVARRHLGEAVHEGDVVEIGGYPQAANPVVRVVRDGRVVAAVYVFPVIEGGWLVQNLTWCVDDSTTSTG